MRVDVSYSTTQLKTRTKYSRLDLFSNDKIYVAGVPSELNLPGLVAFDPYIGCLKNVVYKVDDNPSIELSTLRPPEIIQKGDIKLGCNSTPEPEQISVYDSYLELSRNKVDDLFTVPVRIQTDSSTTSTQTTTTDSDNFFKDQASKPRPIFKNTPLPRKLTFGFKTLIENGLLFYSTDNFLLPKIYLNIEISNRKLKINFQLQKYQIDNLILNTMNIPIQNIQENKVTILEKIACTSDRSVTDGNWKTVDLKYDENSNYYNFKILDGMEYEIICQGKLNSTVIDLNLNPGLDQMLKQAQAQSQTGEKIIKYQTASTNNYSKMNYAFFAGVNLQNIPNSFYLNSNTGKNIKFFNGCFKDIKFNSIPISLKRLYQNSYHELYNYGIADSCYDRIYDMSCQNGMDSACQNNGVCHKATFTAKSYCDCSNSQYIGKTCSIPLKSAFFNGNDLYGSNYDKDNATVINLSSDNRNVGFNVEDISFWMQSKSRSALIVSIIGESRERLRIEIFEGKLKIYVIGKYGDSPLRQDSCKMVLSIKRNYFNDILISKLR